MADAGILVPLRLTGPQVKMLEFMAERGAEIAWSWEKCRPDVVQMMTDLVEKRLISDLPAEGRIRLTDQGRQAVSQIEAAKNRARVIQA